MSGKILIEFIDDKIFVDYSDMPAAVEKLLKEQLEKFYRVEKEQIVFLLPAQSAHKPLYGLTLAALSVGGGCAAALIGRFALCTESPRDAAEVLEGGA